MDDNFDELVIDVRANTRGFVSDLEAINSTVDTSLIDAFEEAGQSLERSLTSALRKGSLGFDDLKRIGVKALDEIAAQAISLGVGSISGGQSGGLGGLIGNSLGALLGLPGRATGGPVSPGRGYLVGENGPELFVPTSAGRVESGDRDTASGRDVRVAISMVTPHGTNAPTAMRRSSRQVASAVRQALEQS
ncbi:MAG: tail tape measure protein [Erythrobacter sp.]|uniref:tail tape measure protein n=1 Tax=Erythrobacter sp. TaxID=1042 RepID=UPI0026217675|nr:tail tape measure protein [Erythrobacter sp.]MDJ0979502.1 tail tape measure protein [Erythrobacter sp.]